MTNTSKYGPVPHIQLEFSETIAIVTLLEFSVRSNCVYSSKFGFGGRTQGSGCSKFGFGWKIIMEALENVLNASF